MRRLVGAAAVAVALAACTAAGGRTGPNLTQLAGQHILARIEGTRPSPAFLRRVRAGAVGGVILFGDNIGPRGPAQLVSTLQATARAGGQPPLLIAIDQEGGVVKRLPDGPPSVRPSQMPGVSSAWAQGVATGRYLRHQGISIDLAPVLDVPVSRRAFIAPRAFSSDPRVVGARGVAFAQGLVAGHEAATAKHFPGLGRLARSTDVAPGVVHASRAALATDLLPFRKAVRAGIPAVMVGTAIYPAYGASLPAACDPAIVRRLLRGALGFKGVAISDALATPGVSPSLSPAAAAARAVEAGIDLVIVGGTTGDGSDSLDRQAFAAIAAAVRAGRITRSQLQASYARIQALKTRFVLTG